jgi:hypothetical protein
LWTKSSSAVWYRSASISLLKERASLTSLELVCFDIRLSLSQRKVDDGLLWERVEVVKSHRVVMNFQNTL